MASTNSHIAIGTLFESSRLHTGLDSASQSHIDQCDLCRERVSWMQTATRLGPQEMTYEPPQSVLDTVLRLGRNPGRLQQLRNFVVASLTFDSFSDLAPAGVRHGDSAARQITFESDKVEIALSLQRSADRKLTVTGQVLAKDGGVIDDAAAWVDLVVEGDHVATSSLSPWGEFVFPDLQPDAYSLRVAFAGQVVHIRSLPD